MFALERQKIILEKLNLDGAVWVSKLSAELGVTEETIRRDLEKLENQEVLVRTHGGAVPITDSSYELSLEKRKQTNLAAKEKLAELMAIRQGKFKYEELIEKSQILFEELSSLREKSALPETADKDKIRDLLLEITDMWERDHAR